MHDLLRDFAGGTQVGIDQHVGLAIERFAGGEEFADFRLGVRVAQQGPVGLVADPVPDFFRRSPKADDEGVCLEVGEVVGIRGQTAAGGNDRAFPGGQFIDQLMFQFAKRGFAIGIKNVGDGAVRALLDQFIGVEVIEVQLFGHEPSDGGLARAHETDEREINDAAVALHANGLTEI